MRDSHSAIPGAVQRQIGDLVRASSTDPRVRTFNLYTQAKIVLIYVAAMALAILSRWFSESYAFDIGAIVLLGGLLLPFIRVFMHSQSHWSVGNGPVRNWVLDHFVSLIYSVPQTGYEQGHLAHHRYDNDWDSRGFPRDLQSTYLFSTDGKPTPVVTWAAFYVLVYQQGIHLLHVLNARSARILASFLFQASAIAAMHVALHAWTPGFYLRIYLPSLVVGWTISALSLFAMHDVDYADSHPFDAVNCVDPVFNAVGDNDGYHIEHTLFPKLHPLYLKEASSYLQPPASHVIHGQYAIASLRKILRSLFQSADSCDGRAVPPAPGRAAGVLALVYAAVTLHMGVIYFLRERASIPDKALFVVFGACQYAPGILAYACDPGWRREAHRLLLTPVGAVRLVRYYFLTVAVLACCVGVPYVAQQTARAYGVDAIQAYPLLEFVPSGLRAPSVFWVFVLGVAPFVHIANATGEELFWRGYLFQGLRGRFADRWAMVLDGVLWGLWHAPMVVLLGWDFPGTPWLGLAVMTGSQVFWSIVLCRATSRDGSLWVPILVHAVANAMTIGLFDLVIDKRVNVLASPWGVLGGVLMAAAGVIEWGLGRARSAVSETRLAAPADG